MTPKRAVLAGGSGFLGQALALELIAKDYEVVVLTRSPNQQGPGPLQPIAWDGRTLGEWTKSLDGTEAVVNLTGRSVNCRYTPENRREIIESRVNSVNAVAEAIAKCVVPPKVWVQAGSLAIYGDPGDAVRDENAPPGEGFSAGVCKQWEGAFNAAKTPSTRKVLLRIGFALGRDGGALGTLAKLARFFLGGTVGHGRQYISWLHVEDLNRMFLWAIEREDIQGAFNATGPTPVTDAEFMRALRRALGRPWSPPAPAWAVRIGSWFMGTEAELALTGRRCVPRRFLEKGFEFRYTALDKALLDLLAEK